jgi:hypothetical protein
MMQIVEIKALDNGGHRNQRGRFKTIPEGWAVVPDDMTLDNFPFGEIEVEEINGVMTVTKWIPGDIPEKKEVAEPVSAIEQLRADVDYIAVMTGVEL